ncbi:hypothetical protein [Arcticibacter sp. MXS-1]|uniref:hypothetical protein n=1 Tax=Arcticibacter sp. MXS-1 TaxID=3341726 RepID=UPI0035A96B85
MVSTVRILFKSFFSYDSTRQRLSRKYNEFVSKQTANLFGHSYEYVEAPFELHNHTVDITGLFDVINSKLFSPKPELIIIEAAAGYGKTCTAYEILNKVSQTEGHQLPIFTELARNRGANIFRYILLDEIDLEFPSLSSQLVLKEVKNGRIPLIIDGFDELLEKVDIDSSTDGSFEEVESMLDTIGNLLEHQSKVILTTRKTAIFTGLEFENWLVKWQQKFEVTRIALKEPRLRDWLGEDKYIQVKEKDVPIQNLANPVLLTFLKHIEADFFTFLLDNPDQLVSQYFEKMLEREKERQNLIMTVENQLLVFKNVAKMLLELDSTVEEKEFFKLIILEDNKKLIEETRNLYSGVNRPTLDNLVDALSTHALLDRKGRDQSQIGFINDFVFGTFLGEVLIESKEELTQKNYSSYMIELAVTAYRVQNKGNKLDLWQKLQPIIEKFSEEAIFVFDVQLKSELVRDYNEISVHDLTFFDVTFDNFAIASSIFLNCYFRNCSFNPQALKGVTFVNCSFNSCKLVVGEFLDVDNEVTAINCIEEKGNILIESTLPKYGSNVPSAVSDFEKEILKNLWSISPTKGHHIVKLLQSFDKSAAKKVNKGLKGLEERGFVNIKGIHVSFNINKINMIKQILNN